MHIETVNITLGAGPSALFRAFIEALPRAPSSDPADPPPDAPTVAAQGTVPKIGDAWPEHGGIYAGISRGEDGAADAHIVLLEATPEDGMTWADAVKWAKSLGDGARLPTRFESALLYANLRDKLDTDNWHWTGTQYSDYNAWSQYFSNSTQNCYYKSAKARARAVRRFVL
jgi:hypothetical protein